MTQTIALSFSRGLADLKLVPTGQPAPTPTTSAVRAIQLEIAGPQRSVAEILPGSVAPGVSADPGNTLAIGSDGGLYTNAGGVRRVLQLDPSRPVAYAGFYNEIVRLDYSSFPPVRRVAHTSNLAADWANRANLAYIAP